MLTNLTIFPFILRFISHLIILKFLLKMNFDGFQIFVLYTQTMEMSQIPGYKTPKTILMEVF